jgi:hypothetical protein
LPAKTDLQRSETAEPAALRIKQSAENWIPIKVRDTKPVEGTVGGYQSPCPPIADDAMVVDRRKGNGPILDGLHIQLRIIKFGYFRPALLALALLLGVSFV